MQVNSLAVIYFLYGLAFFSMGLLVATEGGRAADRRLRMALRPLSGFGIVHALHEWIEMFEIVSLPGSGLNHNLIVFLKLTTLAFSFLSLAAFGSYLVLGAESTWRVSLIIPLILEAVWVFGLLDFKSRYPLHELSAVTDGWTRYSLAIPASLLAAAGLIVQQVGGGRNDLAHAATTTNLS